MQKKIKIFYILFHLYLLLLFRYQSKYLINNFIKIEKNLFFIFVILDETKKKKKFFFIFLKELLVKNQKFIKNLDYFHSLINNHLVGTFSH